MQMVFSSAKVAAPLAGIALSMVAGSVQAQQAIQPGQTVRANLSARDTVMHDGSYSKCYRLKTQPNQLYVVTLSSADFDAFLSAGPGDDCESLTESNDDGSSMGINAQLTLLATGESLMLRANSLNAEEAGAFSLSVSEGEAVRPTRDILPLTLGTSRAGTLSYGDRRAEEASFYDCYRFEMGTDDTVAIRMDSSDVDAYLGLYTGDTCSGVPLATDDDSGGGGSAQIVERLKAGSYSIRANSVGTATGAYNIGLTVRR